MDKPPDPISIISCPLDFESIGFEDLEVSEELKEIEFSDGRLEEADGNEGDANDAANKSELVHPLLDGALEENGADKSAERLHPVLFAVSFLRGSDVEELAFIIGFARGVFSGCAVCPWLLPGLLVFFRSPYSLQRRLALEPKTSRFFSSFDVN